MNPKYLFFGFIALATAFEIVADILFKKWSLSSGKYLLASGLFLYFIGTIFWAFSLRFELISKTISIFTLLNLIIIAIIGVFIFKENLSLLNKVGIALGALSIILIEL